jgi:phage terminase small subunit
MGKAVNKERALSEKQEMFCLEYVRTGNATEAYKAAYNAANMGYATIRVKASQLLARDNIRITIDRLREEALAPAKKRLSISKEWVLEQLVENVSMAKAAEPVLDREGNHTGEYTQNLAAANKSLELIGKELGMFVDRKEVRTGAIDDIPHEEKMAALEAVRQEIAKRRQVH